MTLPRDHGGNLAAAMAQYGGPRGAWLDLSTGINPEAWPVPALQDRTWTALPDTDAEACLLAAARAAYGVPDGARVIGAPGASALICLMPRLATRARVAIPGPTYNEHAAAFAQEGWEVVTRPGPGVTASVIVTPNNPDGRRWSREELTIMAEALDLLVVDESFADPTPDRSSVALAEMPGVVILKSFGKFFGLAGLRLGFAIAAPATAARLAGWLGPWAVSGPALEIGAAALADLEWQAAMRAHLAGEAARLAALGAAVGWRPVGGTALFQTFETGDAAAVQAHLAQHRIWSRVFPYAPGWLRLGLPGAAGWERLERALA